MLTKRRGAELPAHFAGEQLTCGGGHSLVSGPTVKRAELHREEEGRRWWGGGWGGG